MLRCHPLAWVAAALDLGWSWAGIARSRGTSPQPKPRRAPRAQAYLARCLVVKERPLVKTHDRFGLANAAPGLHRRNGGYPRLSPCSRIDKGTGPGGRCQTALSGGRRRSNTLSGPLLLGRRFDLEADEVAAA